MQLVDRLELKWATTKGELKDYYNRKYQAAWYKSEALIGGWITAGLAFLPDLLQWAIVDNFDLFTGIVLPTLDPLWKAALLGFYVTFVAPPLRARLQKNMQAAAVKQAVERGDAVITVPADAQVVVAVDRPNAGDPDD